MSHRRASWCQKQKFRVSKNLRFRRSISADSAAKPGTLLAYELHFVYTARVKPNAEWQSRCRKFRSPPAARSPQRPPPVSSSAVLLALASMPLVSDLGPPRTTPVAREPHHLRRVELECSPT
jgi:hypothetical protein